MNLRAAAILLAAVLPGVAQVLDSAAEVPAVTPSTPPPAELPISPVPSPFNEARILGVMPDYQTVRDTTHYVRPLTAREKWELANKETVDPFNIATAFMTAAFSQQGNETPKYGEGWPNYGKRVGAAFADFSTQNYFSAGVLANVFHQDPRYFRKGPQAKLISRVCYSVTRLFMTPQDDGREAFNVSNIGGVLMGIGASNLYYPAASRRGSVMLGRVTTSLFGGAVGNLMSEFWPDVQDKFFRKKIK